MDYREGGYGGQGMGGGGPIYPGCRVLIDGFKSHPEYNNTFGLAVKQEDPTHWKVKLDKDDGE